jgi:hypothetical protein
MASESLASSQPYHTISGTTISGLAFQPPFRRAYLTQNTWALRRAAQRIACV